MTIILPKVSKPRRVISTLRVLKRRVMSSCPASSPSSISRVSVEKEENPESISENGLKIRSMSYESLQKLTGCVDGMHEDVGKLLLASERDLRKNPELFNLANEFFNTNSELTHLCESLKDCLEKAHRGETLVEDALSDFIEEKRVSGEEASFRKTLEDLRSFKSFSGDDPFSGDFTKLFHKCHGDLVKLTQNLNRTTKKLERRLRRIRRRRRVTVTVIISALVTVVVSAVAVGLTVAPPVLAAFGAIVSVFPVFSLGIFVSSLWQKTSSVLKRLKDAVSSMERGTCVALTEIAKISGQVNRLEGTMRSMEATVGTAAEQKSPLSSAMEEVEKELLSYRAAVSFLAHEADICDEDAQLSRDTAREKISVYLTRYQRTSGLKGLFSSMAK